jgi:hypothetical protein
MKLERLPGVHQNLMVAFCTRNFIHMHNGAVIGAGRIIRAFGGAESLPILGGAQQPGR